MPMDLLAVIERGMPSFSKGQKLIGRFITQHYDKAAFMTASRLGDTVGVSESTVVRFATEVGFEGYPQLQKNLQEIIRNRLTTVQRMDIIDEQIAGSDVLTKVMSLDSEKIRRTMEEADRAAFAQAVEAIVTAREVYILGIRSSSMLASFLAFYFNQIFPHVRCVNSNSTSETFEQMFRIGGEDVFIAISFPRYSQRTLKAAQYAKSQGARVIAITDSTSAPLAQAADILLNQIGPQGYRHLIPFGTVADLEGLVGQQPAALNLQALSVGCAFQYALLDFDALRLLLEKDPIPFLPAQAVLHGEAGLLQQLPAKGGGILLQRRQGQIQPQLAASAEDQLALGGAEGGNAALGVALIGAQQGQRRRTFFFWRPVEGQHRPSTVRRPKHRFVKIPQVYQMSTKKRCQTAAAQGIEKPAE